MLKFLGTITIPAGTSRNNTNTGAARLDLGTLTAAHFNAWLRMIAPGTGGNAWTISAAADSPLAGGVTIDVDTAAKTIEVHFEDGVSTIADFEAAVAALTGDDKVFAVDIAGTGATVLAAPGDDFVATNFAGGAAGAFAVAKSVRTVILLTTAATQYVEILPDAEDPATVATTAATGLPLTATNQTWIGVDQSFGAEQAIAIWNATGGATTVRVWAVSPTF